MIGERLKALRKEKGLSQKELAKALDTSQGYISDIEQGIKKPGADFLVSLKRFFEIDLNWFLMDEGKGVVERAPIYLPEVGPADKKKLKLSSMLARIINEGDEKKIKAVEAQLDLLDPGEKRSKKAENG